MKRMIQLIFIALCLLIISSCSTGAQENSAVNAPSTATATLLPPTQTPAPTPNPYLVDEEFQPSGATIFGKGSINRSFLSKDGSTILVQTALGTYIYDVDSGEELGFAQIWEEVVSFDGRYGYMLKTTHASYNDDGEITYEYRNMLPFLWDGKKITVRFSAIAVWRRR